MNEYGLSSIWRMTDDEKERQIVKKKLEERELRQDGDLEDVEQMFASVLKVSYSNLMVLQFDCLPVCTVA